MNQTQNYRILLRVRILFLDLMKIDRLTIRNLGIIQEVEEESKNTFSKTKDLMKKLKEDLSNLEDESEGEESPESQHENKPSLQEMYEKDKKKNVMKLLQMEYML